MSEAAIEEAVKKACQGGSSQVTPQQSDPSMEALERVNKLESRFIRVEGTTAELEAIQKHQLEEVHSRIASLDSTITKSVQENQRGIKSLETKQASNEAEARRLAQRLESLAAKVDSHKESVQELKKELLKALDSHSHYVASLPNGGKELKVKRSKTLEEVITELCEKA
jgi:chromosome segregation ATPase